MGNPPNDPDGDSGAVPVDDGSDDPPVPRTKWPIFVDLDHPLLRAIVSLLGSIWQVIVWFWIVVVLATIAAPLLAAVVTGSETWQEALSSPTRWPIFQFMVAHFLLALLLVAGAALFTWLCKRANGAKQHYKLLVALRNEFLVERVSAVAPQRMQMLNYFAALYVRRTDARLVGHDALLLARKTLRSRVKPEQGQHIGVIIFGRSMQGKTRLAWEAMRAELASWTVVSWPLTPSAAASFDVDLFRGRRVALWLDDLHRYANDAFAPTLCGLPQRFADAHIPLAVVATCRDERRETQAREYFGSLLGDLQEVWPADITESQAHTLAEGLVNSPENTGATEKSEEFYFDRWDEQTPGSILLGPAYMQNTVGPNLTDHARYILWTLQALYAARVRTFTLMRIKTVCHAHFHWPQGDDEGFYSALMELLALHYVTINDASTSLEPLQGDPASGIVGQDEVNIPESYLEQGIPEYVRWNGDLTRSWEDTERALIDARDAEALLGLGEAYFTRSQRPAFSQAEQYTLRRHAEACYRHASEDFNFTRDQAPFEWVTAAHNLAVTLHAQTHCLPGDAPGRREKVKQLLTEAREIVEEVEEYCRKQYHDTGLTEWESRAQQARRTKDIIWNAITGL